MTGFGINHSEFCSETLAAASFCILVLFAQLIHSDIPMEHPKACLVWRWGAQMCFYTCFYQQGDCRSDPVQRPRPPFKKVNFLRGCAHPLNWFVDQLLLLQLKHTCCCTFQNTRSCSELLHRGGDLDCSLVELIHLFSWAAAVLKPGDKTGSFCGTVPWAAVRGWEDVMLSAAKTRVLPTSCAERHMFGGGFREGEEHD